MHATSPALLKTGTLTLILGNVFSYCRWAQNNSNIDEQNNKPLQCITISWIEEMLRPALCTLFEEQGEWSTSELQKSRAPRYDCNETCVHSFHIRHEAWFLVETFIYDLHNNIWTQSFVCNLLLHSKSGNYPMIQMGHHPSWLLNNGSIQLRNECNKGLKLASNGGTEGNLWKL